MVLVPTRSDDYKENRVIRIFKPVLKYAKENAWPEDDYNDLQRLYQKSLKSCGAKMTQGTITEFFRKKK